MAGRSRRTVGGTHDPVQTRGIAQGTDTPPCRGVRLCTCLTGSAIGVLLSSSASDEEGMNRGSSLGFLGACPPNSYGLVGEPGRFEEEWERVAV